MTLLKSLAHHEENVLFAYIRMATTHCPLKAWVDEVREQVADTWRQGLGFHLCASVSGMGLL